MTFSRSKQNNLITILIILGVVIFLVFFDHPVFWDDFTYFIKNNFGLPISLPKFPKILQKPYRLGLDLAGGTHLVYVADTAQIAAADRDTALGGLRDVIERRVNLFGVTEPLVQIDKVGNESRLIVELAGISDIKQAIQLIGETPYLEFREQGEQNNQKVWIATGLNGQYLKRAQVQFDPTTLDPVVALEFNSEGATLFQQITKRNIGKQVAIFLDGAPISAPTVRSEISGGRAVITGRFTTSEAKKLVERFNAGALPVPIKLIFQQSVGSSLGSFSIQQSVKASIIGILAIILFMILFYRLPGLIASSALLVYIVVVLAIFKSLGVTLTLAGIAGFVMSAGMAVDANILIFARMKEESRQAKPLALVIQEGFRRAWNSIRDSNFSTLITAGILFWFGTSLIKGFALTLIIGIISSLFSAIFVTRILLGFLPDIWLEKYPSLLGLSKK